MRDEIDGAARDIWIRAGDSTVSNAFRARFRVSGGGEPVESWAEHLRQHERFTNADREMEDRVRRWQANTTPIAVSHHIYARRPKGSLS